MTASAALRVVALSAALLTALGGCQSGPKVAPGAGLVIVSEHTAEGAIAADDLFSEKPVQATYIVVAGKETGAEKSFTRTATDKFGASMAEKLAGSRTEFLRRDDDGNIVLCAVIDEPNNALSLFDPPLVVMPASLPPHEAFSARSSMRVVDADNPKRDKERGSATRTVEYIGDRVLHTPFGDVECHQLVVTFAADLRMADAETRTTLHVSPRYGVVAEQWSEKVKVLGALSSEHGGVIVLATEPK